MPKPTHPDSPARRDLARALQALRIAEQAHAATTEPIARLEAEIEAETAARARLARLDAAHADRMVAWAATPAAPPPEPDQAARQEAEAALAKASAGAEAARTALQRWRREADQAAGRVAAAAARIRPAVAAVLREDGAVLVTDYWRHWAALEQTRRDLAALDQLLIDDFPLTHTPTGRRVVDYLSPDRRSATDWLRATKSASNTLTPTPEAAARWRTRAAELMG